MLYLNLRILMDADILNAKQNVIYPLAIVIFFPLILDFDETKL